MSLCRAATGLLGAFAGLATGIASAQAQGSLTAHYTISMTGFSIGRIVWIVDIGDALYTASATGKASGVLSMLVNGEGSVKTNGAVAAGVLAPAQFISKIVDDDGDTELQMTFADGMAQARTISGPPPQPRRLPVTDEERRGVSDPLSAVLVPLQPGTEFQTAENCSRTLRIFDGRRRYDLVLSFGRTDKFKSERGYSGPVLVCAVVLHPIAGYKPDSMLVKYVANRRDMELWFAPVAGTRVMAPILVAMPTLIGTLKIDASQFETAAAPPPSPAPVTSEPLLPPSETPPVQPAARP
jgi:hypothetical protein